MREGKGASERVREGKGARERVREGKGGRKALHWISYSVVHNHK